VQAVREGGGGGLVDDALDLEAGDPGASEASMRKKEGRKEGRLEEKRARVLKGEC
jgi:hypothetical protein